MSPEIEACCEPVFRNSDWEHNPECEHAEELTRGELIQELVDLRNNREVTIPGTARFNELDAMIAGLKQAK